MVDKMMDEFENVFPKPKYVIRCGNVYSATEYGAWGAHDYCQKWIGWGNSRENLVVDLPNKLPHTQYDLDFKRIYAAGFNDALKSCTDKLQELGIKIK